MFIAQDADSWLRGAAVVEYGVAITPRTPSLHFTETSIQMYKNGDRRQVYLVVVRS